MTGFDRYHDDPAVHAAAADWWNRWCDAQPALAGWRAIARAAPLAEGLMAVRADGSREIEIYATSRAGVAAEVLEMNGPMDAVAVRDWTELTGTDPAPEQMRGMHDIEALAWAEAHYRPFAAFVQREGGVERLIVMAEADEAPRAAAAIADFVAGRPVEDAP